MVASRNGAPMIAPTATSSEPSAPPMIATIGISVSGIAVPTAARRLPVAPSPILSRCPAHSTALVNSIAPARITAKLAASRTYSTVAPTYLCVEECEGQDHVDRKELDPLEPVRLPVLGRVGGDQHCDEDGAELEAVERERHRARPEDEREQDQDRRDEQGNLS